MKGLDLKIPHVTLGSVKIIMKIQKDLAGSQATQKEQPVKVQNPNHGNMSGLAKTPPTQTKYATISDMSADEFTKLFSFMEKRFNDVESKLNDKSEKMQVNKLIDMIDSVAKRQEINDDERLVMGHQLSRLDKWVHDLAVKIDYELK